MLSVADRGYVVINNKKNRSMKTFISKCTVTNDFRTPSGHGSDTCTSLYQLNLRSSDDMESSPPFWHVGLRVGCLETLLEELLNPDRYCNAVYDWTTVPSALVLATQTRRADLCGPALQRVHTQVGMYLADQLLDCNHICGGSLTTVSSSPFEHVQKGRTFTGTVPSGDVLIVSMMRSGDPMARGVYERFPSATYMHYNDDEDEKAIAEQSQTIKDKVSSIIIVDAVINSGTSIRRILSQFFKAVDRVTEESSEKFYSIYVLTGVIQEKTAISLPKEYPTVMFLALRISKNQYTGRGGTDTGNRLFGTY